MSTFEIRGVVLTEDSVKSFKENTKSANPIDSLVEGFNTVLKGSNQHKLSQKEKTALYKWLYDTKLFRNYG
jgi:hypothetical protein